MLGVSSLSMLCLLVFATLCYVSTAQRLFDCCFTYTKKPLPFRVIKGYVTQNSNDVCDMDAIIFITKRFKVCANPKDKWVIKIIKAFRGFPKIEHGYSFATNIGFPCGLRRDENDYLGGKNPDEFPDFFTLDQILIIWK